MPKNGGPKIPDQRGTPLVPFFLATFGTFSRAYVTKNHNFKNQWFLRFEIFGTRDFRYPESRKSLIFEILVFCNIRSRKCPKSGLKTKFSVPGICEIRDFRYPESQKSLVFEILVFCNIRSRKCPKKWFKKRNQRGTSFIRNFGPLLLSVLARENAQKRGSKKRGYENDDHAVVFLP